jgi:hypothetical protein
MATKLTLTHEQRVELYVKIIREKLGGPLTDFNVALMRTKCPSQVELDALNAALLQLGWQR